jgi:D-sedoheptulose 7-phosphate isomerase
LTRSWHDILAEHARVTADLGPFSSVLDAIADALIATFRRGGRVYLFGNGGSAADAQHIAAELIGRFRRNRRALPAVALTTDTSALTAIGNDFGFEQIFARQVEGLAGAGDIAWGLSTSGNSRNILAALRMARKRGAATIGFTGQSGGEMAPLCDHLFAAPTVLTDRIQESHTLAYHYVCERVENAFAEGAD